MKKRRKDAVARPEYIHQNIVVKKTDINELMSLSAHHRQACTGRLGLVEKRTSMLYIQCKKCEETFTYTTEGH